MKASLESRSVALLVAAGLMLSAGAAETLVNFEQDKVGLPPSGWTCTVTGEGTPVWRVMADPTAPSPPRVLVQAGRVPKPSFPLCLWDGARVRDGFVEVKFKPVSGEVDQAGGVVWRARDAANYYLCRANALETNVVLYKVEQGKRTSLAPVDRPGSYGVEAKVRSDSWQTLRVEFAGARFRVFLEGRELFRVEDLTFSEAGRVGLWTKADSVTEFDDFRWGETGH